MTMAVDLHDVLRSDLDTLERLFRGAVPDSLEEDRDTFYEEIAFAIRERGEAGRTFLLDQLSENPSRARLEAIVMALPAEARDAPIVGRYVHSEVPRVRAAAVRGLGHLRAVEWESAVLEHLEDREPLVRGAVLDFLGDTRGSDSAPYLRNGLSDPASIVRQAAIDRVHELAEPDAELVEQVRPLLEDPDPHVRQAARWLFPTATSE